MYYDCNENYKNCIQEVFIKGYTYYVISIIIYLGWSGYNINDKCQTFLRLIVIVISLYFTTYEVYNIRF